MIYNTPAIQISKFLKKYISNFHMPSTNSIGILPGFKNEPLSIFRGSKERAAAASESFNHSNVDDGVQHLPLNWEGKGI